MSRTLYFNAQDIEQDAMSVFSKVADFVTDGQGIEKELHGQLIGLLIRSAGVLRLNDMTIYRNHVNQEAEFVKNSRFEYKQFRQIINAIAAVNSAYSQLNKEGDFMKKIALSLDENGNPVTKLNY